MQWRVPAGGERGWRLTELTRVRGLKVLVIGDHALVEGSDRSQSRDALQERIRSGAPVRFAVQDRVAFLQLRFHGVLVADQPLQLVSVVPNAGGEEDALSGRDGDVAFPRTARAVQPESQRSFRAGRSGHMTLHAPPSAGKPYLPLTLEADEGAALSDAQYSRAS